MKNDQKVTVEARRSFLKKARYVAPALILLGSLEASAKPAQTGNNGNSKLVGKGKK